MAASDAALLFRIKGDSSDAVKAIKDTKKASDDLTGSVTTAGSAFSSLAGPVGIAAGAITSIGAGALAAGAALFTLTKNAADFGSQIYDASQKTGLHAETLSALKFAAEQAGGSFDGLVRGVGNFQKTLGEAELGSEKAAKSMKTLGVTSTDTETALNQAVKTIYNAKDANVQAALAAEAFGAKLGRELLPLIKDAHGDFETLKDRARELGITISDEAAAKSDEFGDTMDQLNAQLGAVGRTIGIELMPVFTDMAKSMSDFLSENKDSIRSWGTSTADTLRGLISLWAALRFQAESYFGIKGLSSIGTTKEGVSPFGLGSLLGGLGGFLLEQGGAQERLSDPNNTALLRFRKRIDDARRDADDKGLDTSGGGKGTKPPKTTDDQFRKFFQEMGFSVVRTFGDAINKGSLHPLGKAIDISVRGKTEDEIARLVAAAIEKGYRFVDERQKIPGVKQTGPHLHFEQNNGPKGSVFGAADAYGGIPVDYLKGLDDARLGKLAGSAKKIEDYRKKQTDEARKAADEMYRAMADGLDRELEQFTATKEREKDEIELSVKQGVKSESDGLRERREIDDQILQKRLEVLEAMRVAAGDETEKLAKIEQAEYLLFEEIKKKKIKDIGELIDEMEKIRKSFAAAMKAGADEADEIAKRVTETLATPGGNDEEWETRTDAQIRQAEAQADAVDRLKESYHALFDEMARAADMQATMTDLGHMGLDLIGSMTDALETAIERWLLYGESVGKALQQALAAELAHVAAKAAVKALEATAYGFLFLALGQFHDAALAFQSAAVWAAVAVTAGVAAKALAPAASGGRGVNGSSGSADKTSSVQRNPDGQGQQYSSQKDRTDEYGRSSSLLGRFEVELTMNERNPRWFSQMFDAEIKNNTNVRRQIRDGASN